MAYKLKFKAFRLFFRLFSFLADKSGGWGLFVKPKLFLGSLILGLSITACNSKKSNSSVSEKTDNKDSIALQNDIPDSLAIVPDEIPEVTCYEPAEPMPPEILEAICYDMTIEPVINDSIDKE